MQDVDVLVVGAGMTGAVAARSLADAGYRILVLDSRAHVGGNCYDALDAHGVCIHPYGPHIFHTSKQDVIDFLSRFTHWQSYEHRVMALVAHRLIPLPFNLTSLAICFGQRAAKLSSTLIDLFGENTAIPILELRRSGHTSCMELADFIYENVFLGYTSKQWGLRPDELNEEVTARVPIRLNHDARYFTDSFQNMPAQGFTSLFEQMLAHPKISVRLNTPYTTLGNEQGQATGPVTWRHCLYTGPIDSFFLHNAGPLPYRSLKFEFEHYPQERHLPAPVLNYPEADVPWTRIAEYKQLTGQEVDGTSVSVEYALAHQQGQNEPYYPVVSPASAALLERYTAQAAALPTVSFAGRLGDFRYYNMDDAAEAGLHKAAYIHTLLQNS